MKIDAVNAATAHHIVDGAVVFPYAVDAHSAVSRHPHEWSMVPWTAERAAKARAARPDLPPAMELAPEDQQAVDEHTQAQREAADRLAAYDAEQADKLKLEEQIAADRALVAAPPPAPDPNVRRPFGRKGEPTEKERALLAKRAAEKAEADRRTQESLAVSDRD